MDSYNTSRVSTLIGGVVDSVTHRFYCDSVIQLCFQKIFIIVLYHLFYHLLHVPDIIITLGGFRSTLILCPQCDPKLIMVAILDNSFQHCCWSEWEGQQVIGEDRCVISYSSLWLQLVIIFPEIDGNAFSEEAMQFLLIEPCPIYLSVICQFAYFVETDWVIITWGEFS